MIYKPTVTRRARLFGGYLADMEDSSLRFGQLGRLVFYRLVEHRMGRSSLFGIVNPTSHFGFPQVVCGSLHRKCREEDDLLVVADA